MMFKMRVPAGTVRLLSFAAAAFLVPGGVSGQTKAQSPSDLIKFLTYQSDERKGSPWIFRCGLVNTDRAAARKLVELGDLSIPQIEAAVASISEYGEQSEFGRNGGWLLLAYARIKGEAAVPKLRPLIGNPHGKAAFLDFYLDSSLALSFGLTSYISNSRDPTDVDCRSEQPRDALDRLILAWEKNDREGFVESLGPTAAAALNQLLAGRTWESMRAEFWGGTRRTNVSMGYRFDTSGPWSKPEETLLAESQEDFPVAPVKFDLDALFVNDAGGDCGRHRLTFLSDGDGLERPWTFRIDNWDIGDLLRRIGFCTGSM